VLSFAAALPGAIVSHVAKGFFPGGWGGYSSGVFGSDLWMGRRLPGSKLDWKAEAGDLWKNSAVGACLWYLCDTLPEAPMYHYRDEPTAMAIKQPTSALSLLLQRPNPAYSGSALLSATLLSLKTDGNAYWRIRRNVAGRIVEVWYIPHWCMEPRWETTDSFIDYYDYYPGSGAAKEKLRPSDIVHFREGLDPENTRKGLSRLRNVLREIVTDNEATTFSAAVLKNFGVPGVIISPKGPDAEFSNTLADKLKSLWREKMTGDKRGEPLIMPSEVNIEAPGYSPEQMTLDKIRQVPEARICAALRVPAMVVGLSVGDGQRTYSNMGEARELAYEGTIIPLQNLLCDHIVVQLAPQMPGWVVGDSVRFDLSSVRVLQDDQDALFKRLALGYDSGFLKRSDVRSILGLIVDSGDDIYKIDPASQTAAPTNATKSAIVRAEWQRKSRERRERAEMEA
jgi:HK97 family phage portal protein